MLSAIPRKLSRVVSCITKSYPKNQPRELKYHTASPTFYAQSPQKPDQPEEIPSFSWKELGASRTAKFVIIGSLGIVGTLETIFYAKILMRRMGWDSVKEG